MIDNKNVAGAKCETPPALTREQPYGLVWAEPMLKAAARWSAG